MKKMDWRMQGESRMLPMDLRNLFTLDNIQAPMKNRPKKKRKSPDGITTNKLVFSAQQGTNDEIFPSILKLYMPRGSKIQTLLMAEASSGAACRSTTTNSWR